MYHRIDGKLVAVNVIDILDTIFVSVYCIYDPDYSFLSLGVVTVVEEIEYFRMLKVRGHRPDLKWYSLSDLVVTCPKVNYKLKYKPGFFICPRTKEIVPVQKCLPLVEIISQLSIEEKMNLPHI